ncbi:bacteriophage tail fiber assembly protein [Serratia plymuthica A30]|uniref:prophage tail fiber N-terminal domain-containing protein n=1 Tax=Serratia plymuthica TaxID=82996 RepID=UPI0002A2DA8C|nr:prophage tail fiber N-terminal domain-containing protein [Serratia plymuthica]EKF63498.1 bacteriophage tail fiber assembly protein [Serratia plymuthica A30]
MAVLISGKLIGPNGDPRPGVTIMLTAVKTSSAVVHLAPSSSTTGPDGSYSLSVEVGTHNVMIEAYGRPFEKVGQITVYSDSKPGTLNDFLTSPGQEELTPAIVAIVDDMRAAAAVYAQQAMSARDQAMDAASEAQNIADANTYYISPTDPDGTISGVAGTPDGKMFRVAIRDEEGQGVIFNYYKNEGGSAVFINAESSKRHLDMVIEEINNLVGFSQLVGLDSLTGSNYIRKADGVRVPSTDWRNSTYISVKAGKKINLTASNNNAAVANIAFYDASQAFISADNVGVGSTVNTRMFTVPVDGFVILATRIATSMNFECELINDVMTTGNKDKPGGYVSRETFVDVIGNVSSGEGANAFTNSGYVSVSNPKEYPTASETALSTDFIKVSKGDTVHTNLAISSAAYAVAFFTSNSPSTFFNGVIGVSNEAVLEYTYLAPADGYVVLSTASTVLPTAVAGSNYSIGKEILNRSVIDSAMDFAIPSVNNLVENGMSDVYYADVDAKLTAVVTEDVYVLVSGEMVANSSRRSFAVTLAAGESLYAKVNIGVTSATSERGAPVLSRFISSGVFEPLTFCFSTGNVYTEHMYTADQACTIYVAAYKTEGSLPPIIRKRKYAKGDKTRHFTYTSPVFDEGVLHSISNNGRLDTNVAYITTPLIPVKKGDVVTAMTAQNSSAVGSNQLMGVKYDEVGKFIKGTLQFTFNANTEYGYAVTEITEDGFIAVNHYTLGGLASPKVVVLSKGDALRYSIKAPASNPYGDIYPGRGYKEDGTLGKDNAGVTYLFDRLMTPMDATITLSFNATSISRYLVKLDANRGLIRTTTLPVGINTFSLTQLFDTPEVEFVGVTHGSDGRVDTTSMNFSVESRRGEELFFELSEPVYNLYNLAGRPDKTLAYDYTPLLQKLCFQMERQKRGKVYFESGVYKVSGCYVKSFNHFFGDGMHNTKISGADVPFKNEKLSNKVYEKITFENLGFDLDLLPQRAGRAINMEYVKDLVVRNIWIHKSLITGFGVDMMISGVLDNIVTEGCGQNQQDGSCAGMGIGVGAFLTGQEPIQVINCINRNNFGHGMFFEWHNHRESSGETVIGDFPVGIQVVNCYSEGNAVGFGNAGGNGVSFVNCTAFRNLNGFAADNGSVVSGVRYGKNALFADCKAIENGESFIQNPYFIPRQMGYGSGNGFAIYKTASYTDPEIGDNARGYYFNNCISEDNETYALRVSVAPGVTTPVKDVQINGGSFSRSGGSGIQISAATENLFIRGCLNVDNGENGIGIGAQIIDGIIKDNIVKGNAKGITAGAAASVDTTIVRDNIVKGNILDLENVTNS